jgi:hypothetical protein
MIVTTLVLQYVLANAAVARAFSSYFAALIGKPPSFFVFAWQDYTVDFMAAGLMIACCLMLSFSTAGGSWFNIFMTGSQLLVILIILIAGFVKANPANLKPFLPFGVKGALQPRCIPVADKDMWVLLQCVLSHTLCVMCAGLGRRTTSKAAPDCNTVPVAVLFFAGIFDGASFVFFSFIGFDCVSTLAEEVSRANYIQQGGDGSALAVHVSRWHRLMLHAGYPAACSTASNDRRFMAQHQIDSNNAAAAAAAAAAAGRKGEHSTMSNTCVAPHPLLSAAMWQDDYGYKLLLLLLITLLTMAEAASC